MTNKEVIRLIRNLPTMCEFTDAYGEPIDSDAYYEAVDIAISALHAQDAPDINVGSMIKDAIDRINEYIEEYSEIDSDGNHSEKWCAMQEAKMIIENMPSAQPEQRWIPCDERLPEENHWLGGSGKQFSDEVLVNVVNYDDEDMWVYISQTIDGMWALELPRHCEITAWCELPEPYKEKNDG